MSDEELVDPARHGDEAAFRTLYERYRDPLYWFAWRMTGSRTAAEDLTHDCFLAVLDRNGRFDACQGPFRGWLFGVMRHLLARRLRHLEREAGAPGDVSCEPLQLQAMEATERANAVARAIQALPVLQREALVLFEYEKLPLEEIARIASAEVGAVKARLFRARESLRQRLAALMPERRLP